jgi:hypothetical protein
MIFQTKIVLKFLIFPVRAIYPIHLVLLDNHIRGKVNLLTLPLAHSSPVSRLGETSCLPPMQDNVQNDSKDIYILTKD